MTRLKTALPQAIAAVGTPPKFTVPPLALKVAAALMVRLLLKLVVADEAVKIDPAFTTTAAGKVTPALGMVTVPPVWVYVLLILTVL